MSSIVLSAGGKKLGGIVGGAVSGGNAAGSVIGSSIFGGLGKIAGNIIDSKLLTGRSKFSSIQGAGVSSSAIQSSAYGKTIPIVYGLNRIAGNIIWSLPIKEVVTTTTSSTGGGKGGPAISPSSSQTSTDYNYFATVAIAICEGEIDEVLRVWADSKLLNPDDGVFRLYKGTEDQMPDSLIESTEGIGKTPAYRGLAYVVIEDFPLEEYGNRIPNFTFEVKRKTLNNNNSPVEEEITAMMIIPGAGEYVYDDTVQFKVLGEEVNGNFIEKGNRVRVNQNNHSAKADGLLSLDHLQETCPNLEWVSPVVVWFGNDLDAGNCILRPGVDFQGEGKIEPDDWNVAGVNRSSAYLISTDVDNRSNYGGTPNDASLLRYLTELKSRGYKIMFNPMLFMDVVGKTWRGELTGSAEDCASFFTKTNGYNTFILHYANLVKNHVDAFIIGSELIGLTRVRDFTDNSFPGVDELINLAASVKAIVGSEVKVTYAADWSEYHHTDGGWYNMDPLWASSDIDFIGIDCYFPLTNSAEPVGGFDIDTIKQGWRSGEGYDFVYDDETRTSTTAVSDEYAWKNIDYWWKNNHTNPDGNQTGWVPESKKIWFTELGYPSVDGASNQPNVFYDPASSNSAFPRLSKGRVDFRAQRNAITASLSEWKNSNMVEKIFLYAWDARPFPFWPDMTSVWSDGNVWRTGHWLQGKLGVSNVGAITLDIVKRIGLDENKLDTSRLNSLIEGFVIDSQVTARQAIDQLRQAFFFDAVESDGLIKFVPRGALSSLSIPVEDLVPGDSSFGTDILTVTRAQELELPQKIDVNYINPSTDYQPGNQHAQRLATFSKGIESVSLPIVMSDQTAKEIADITLFTRWLERKKFSFMLPIKYARIEPGDVITIVAEYVSHVVRVEEVNFGAPGLMEVYAVAEDLATYRFDNAAGTVVPATTSAQQISRTNLQMLDLPLLPFDAEDGLSIRFAAVGEESGWRGAVIYRSDDGGESYQKFTSTPSESTIGSAETLLGSALTNVFDYNNSVTISLKGNGELKNATELAVLNGANAALIGDEIIQFKTAVLLEQGKYALSGLLRGRLGTEHAISSHQIGERFILLDGSMVKESMSSQLIGLQRSYKGVTVGGNIATTESQNFTFNANSKKPYSPVHITGSREFGSDIAIRWIRRSRIDGQWRDNVDVSLGEDIEYYEVDILNSSDQVVRTLDNIYHPEVYYYSYQQVLDFGLDQDSVKVRVYQISSLVGRGYAGEAVI